MHAHLTKTFQPCSFLKKQLSRCAHYHYELRLAYSNSFNNLV